MIIECWISVPYDTDETVTMWGDIIFYKLTAFKMDVQDLLLVKLCKWLYTFFVQSLQYRLYPMDIFFKDSHLTFINLSKKCQAS